MKTTFLAALGFAGLFSLRVLAATPIDPALQPKVDAKLKDIQAWAASPAIVEAVKAQNAQLPPDYAAMTQEKWKATTILDPFVRSFAKNASAEFLKNKKSNAHSEAFLSDANRLKIAFLSKTSNWSHKGKGKHDVPMTGKTWQGAIELDESTGLRQLEIAVPVLETGKPIGSLVVGLRINKL